MPTSLATLITAQDQPSILAVMYTQAAALGVDVVGVQAERLFRALYEIESTAKANEQIYRVNISKGAFLEMAADVSPYSTVLTGATTWLDLLAAGFFNLARARSTPTIGVVRFIANGLALGGSFAANSVTVTDGGGHFYKNLDAFTLAPNTSRNVRMVATVPGSASNVGNNSIFIIQPTIGGVLVGNPAQVGSTSWISVAGTDPERNETLIQRCRARWSTISAGGGAPAYIQRVSEAFAASGLTNTITRIAVDDTNPLGPGTAAVYLANASGPATGTEVSIVDAYLQLRKALGMNVLLTAAATAFTVPLSVTVYGTSSTTAAIAAITNAFSITPLGGRIFIDSITSALLSINGIYNAPIKNGAGVVYLSGSLIQVPTGNVPVVSLAINAVP